MDMRKRREKRVRYGDGGGGEGTKEARISGSSARLY